MGQKQKNAAHLVTSAFAKTCMLAKSARPDQQMAANVMGCTNGVMHRTVAVCSRVIMLPPSLRVWRNHGYR